MHAVLICIGIPQGDFAKYLFYKYQRLKIIIIRFSVHENKVVNIMIIMGKFLKRDEDKN